MRYIDADKALEFIKETNANYHWLLSQYSASWVYDFIESQPTADVVPKSEVERLQAEVERLKKDNEYILMQHRFQRRPSGDCWNDVIEKAKAEVAREIFESIEECIYLYYNKNDYTMPNIEEDIAELKKKYTE